MKFKPFDIIRYYRWLGVSVVPLGIFMMVLAITTPYEEIGFVKYVALAMLLSITTINAYCLHKEAWEKYFATIYISPEKIIWKCPFRKTRQLTTTACYIGVELEEAANHGDYPYIYFSLKPYPREMEHKINKVPCSDEFLKYRYDTDIAEYILKTLPKEQTRRLNFFHYRYNRKW